MAEIRHLRDAPITEALIDFRVTLPEGFSVDSFRKLKEVLSSRYPTVEEHSGKQATVKLEAGGFLAPETRDLGLQALFFRTEDGLTIAQFRHNGFTLNRLRPYTQWSEILPEALELWGRYVSIGQPETVSRLGLRYINHLQIPLPVADFAEYLEAPPVVPDGVPQTIGNFLSKQVIHDLERSLAANVTQSLEKALDEKLLVILLDIDVYKVGEIRVDHEEIVPILETLHDFKNTIFFRSLTEKAVAAYE